MKDLQKLRESKGLTETKLSDAVNDYLDNHGPVKGLRFEQVNALTIMCEWGYITFDEHLENVYRQVIEMLSEEVEDET